MGEGELIEQLSDGEAVKMARRDGVHGGGGDAVVAGDVEVFLQPKVNKGELRCASFAEKEHDGIVLTERMEWCRCLGGKPTVDGGLRWCEWTNGAMEGRGRGGGTQVVWICGGGGKCTVGCSTIAMPKQRGEKEAGDRLGCAGEKEEEGYGCCGRVERRRGGGGPTPSSRPDAVEAEGVRRRSLPCHAGEKK
jgi:hypothetical protein